MATSRYDLVPLLVNLAGSHGWTNESAETSDGRIVLILRTDDEREPVRQSPTGFYRKPGPGVPE